MKLEQQVCSLELARRLKELGVRQESQFYWEKVQKEDWVLSSHEWLMQPVNGTGDENDWPILAEALSKNDAYSAFTAAELGEMLPRRIKKGDTYHAPFIWFGEQATYIQYDNREGSQLMSPIAGSEADARAKMLIYLLENNLIGKE